MIRQQQKIHFHLIFIGKSRLSRVEKNNANYTNVMLKKKHLFESFSACNILKANIFHIIELGEEINVFFDLL